MSSAITSIRREAFFLLKQSDSVILHGC